MPWFVYTSRAFLTLEGVSLQADENFSIIKSCFPYVAKRLLADDSPQAQDALRNLLYGAEKYMEPKRLADLADGFVTYTTTTKRAVEAESGSISVSNGASRGTLQKMKRSTSAAEAANTQLFLRIMLRRIFQYCIFIGMVRMQIMNASISLQVPQGSGANDLRSAIAYSRVLHTTPQEPKGVLPHWSSNIELTLGELEQAQQGDDLVNAAAKGIQ